MAANTINYGKQKVGDEELAAIAEVLAGEWLTQGPATRQFEQDLAVFTGAKHVLAVSSGTAALHVACCALGLGAGDYLWTTPISFIASANCGLYCGGKVDFVDIDPRTRNISLSALSEKLALAKKNNCLPKIIVAVHFSGSPCDLEALRVLKKNYGFYLIEDAAHALGSYFNREPIGASAISEFTALSFHPVKTITTGEGGALTSNDSVLAKKAEAYARQGVIRDPAQWQQLPTSPCYYEQQYLGFNYRMCDLQAAMGSAQLKKLIAFKKRRSQLFNQYIQALNDLPIVLPVHLENSDVCWHIFVIELASTQLRNELIHHLKNHNIVPNIHYPPIHLQPIYTQQGFKKGDYPNAEQYYSRALTLPLHADLQDSEQAEVINACREFLVSAD